MDRQRRAETEERLLVAIHTHPGLTATRLGQIVCGRAVRYGAPLARLVAQGRARVERRLEERGYVSLTYWPVA